MYRKILGFRKSLLNSVENKNLHTIFHAAVSLSTVRSDFFVTLILRSAMADEKAP